MFRNSGKDSEGAECKTAGAHQHQHEHSDSYHHEHSCQRKSVIVGETFAGMRPRAHVLDIGDGELLDASSQTRVFLTSHIEWDSSDGSTWLVDSVARRSHQGRVPRRGHHPGEAWAG